MPFEPTSEQQQILNYRLECHARVLAGPGTGKSATVVKLIDDLLAGAQPPRLKLLTFTRAATAELAEKVSEHPAAATERPSTIHSFALTILLQNLDATTLPQPLRMADDWERANVVNPTLGRRIGVQARRIDNLFREHAANWESLVPAESPRVRPEDRARFLAGWQEHRAIYGYTMLSELPFVVRSALRDHEDLRGLDFGLLVVDEYQDLNACDLDVLRLLTERGVRLLAVGDDDQSIYSFRRAAPDGIRRFHTDYPGSTNYPLSVTHRCGRRIIGWALHVIEGDLTRDPSRPRLTPNRNSPEGEVRLLSFASASGEAKGVAALAKALIEKEHLQPSKILILLRSDYQGTWSGPIKAELAAAGIEYADPEMVSEILGRPSNRILIALLRLMVHRSDSLAWATVLTLTQGIGPVFLDAVYERARNDRSQFGTALLALHSEGYPNVAKAVAGRVRDSLESILAILAAHPIPEERPEGGWGTWIIGLGISEASLSADEDFYEILHQVDGLADETRGLDRYIGQIAPLAKDLAQSSSTGVRIMSMASSKGLTAEATILPGLEAGVMPRPDQDREEERRLLYVAMTRAKRFLFGTWATRRIGPTARAGQGRVQERRSLSPFLDGGPVESELGGKYLSTRWR